MAPKRRTKKNNGSDESLVDPGVTPAEENLAVDGGYQMGIVETDEDEETRDEEKFKRAALELVSPEDEEMELTDSLDIGEYKDDFLELEGWDPNEAYSEED